MDTEFMIPSPSPAASLPIFPKTYPYLFERLSQIKYFQCTTNLMRIFKLEKSKTKKQKMIWLGTIDPTLELAFGQWLNAECVQSVDSSYLERLSLSSLYIDNIRSLALMFSFSKCCSSKLSQKRIVFWTFFSWQPSGWGLLGFPPLSLNKGELSYR